MRRSFKAVAVFAVLCLTPTSYARYYDPEYGRFLSRDEMEGKLDNAPSLHRFVYANANPLRYIDPDGRNSMEGWGGFSPAPLPLVGPIMISPGTPRPDRISAGPPLDFMTGVPQARLLTDAIQVPLAAAVAGPAVGPYVLATAEGLNLGTAISQRDPVNIGLALLPTAFRIGGMRSTILEYQAAKAGIARQNIGLSSAGFGAEIETSPGVFVSKPVRAAASASSGVGEVIEGEFSVVGEQSRPLLPLSQAPPSLPAGTLSSRVIGQYQRFVDESAGRVVDQFNQGRMPVPAGVSARTVLGQRLDSRSRGLLRDWLRNENIPEGRGQDVMVNRRLYNPGPVQEDESFFRIPDLRFPQEHVTVDLTIGTKTPETPQIRDIQNATKTPQQPEGDDIRLVRPLDGPLAH